MKKKINNQTKTILVLPVLTVLILVALFSLSKIILVTPRGHITETDIVFRWHAIDNYAYYRLLVDDNPEFTSPLSIETAGNEYRISNLSVGEHYWKVIGYNKGFVESSVNSFSIDSLVSVNRTITGIRNEGNVPLLIELFAGGITGHAVVNINQILEIKNNTNMIEASQK